LVSFPFMTSSSEKVINLLVCGGLEDWSSILQGMSLSLPDGKYSVNIEHAFWEDMSPVSYFDAGLVCRLNSSRKPFNQRQQSQRMFKPDFIFYRGLCHQIGSRIGREPDFRNALYTIQHSGVPMINSFEAVLLELERPLMYSILRRINKRFGQEVFPVIPQDCFPDHSEFLITPSCPFVAKISFPHAGFGKMVVQNSQQKDDLASVLALHHDYICCEPYIQRASEIRIICIGDFCKVHKRNSFHWKVNRGSNIREDAEMNKKYYKWVELLKHEVPGLDFFSIDAIEAEDGNEYILEFNGSTTGFPTENIDEYYSKVKELLTKKMTEYFSC